MTQQEKQEIIAAVLDALQTNSKSISQLTSVTELLDSDLIEVAGGRRVSYGTVKSLLGAIFDESIDNKLDVNNEVYFNESGRLRSGRATCVVLKSMGSALDNAFNDSQTEWIYNPLVGDTYYDATTKKIVYYEAVGSLISSDPDGGLVYCNAHTGATYRWKGTDWEQVGGMGNDIQIINDLTTGGGDKALSAEMGVLLKANIVSLFNSLSTLYSKLGNIAFWSAQDKADAAPDALDWNVPKKSLAVTNNLANSVITYNGEPVTSSIMVDEGTTVELLVSGATGYAVSSVSVSGATSIDNGDGTFTVRVKVDDDMTLAISGNTVALLSVSITTSNAAGALGLSNTSVQQGGTFVGQITYLDNYYSDFEITSVKDASNNDVSYTLNGNEITIANVPSDITITAIAKYQLKVWFGKSIDQNGAPVDDSESCYTDFVKLEGLTAASTAVWNYQLRRDSVDDNLKKKRCLVFYDKNKRLLFYDSQWDAVRHPMNFTQNAADLRTLTTANLENVLNHAGQNTPVYARISFGATNGEITSGCEFTQGSTEFVDRTLVQTASVAEAVHNLTFSLTHCTTTATGNQDKVLNGQPIEVLIKADSGYSLSNLNVSVTVGGVATTPTVTDYSYNNVSYKKVTVENITGDVVVTASI